MKSQDVAVFLLSALFTGPSFMLISWLALDLWQFLFIKDWPEIPKSQIPPSEFCPISGDWDKLGERNMLRMSLIKKLLNAAKCQNYSFYRFWVIKRQPTREGVGGEGGQNYSTQRLRITIHFLNCQIIFFIKTLKYKLSFDINFVAPVPFARET